MKRYKLKCLYTRRGVPTYVSEICASIKYWWSDAIFEPHIEHQLHCIQSHIEDMYFRGCFRGKELRMDVKDRSLLVWNRAHSAVILTITFEPINE